MINVYFSTTEQSDSIQKDLTEQLGSINSVNIISYDDEKDINVHDNTIYPTIICITPHTYNKDFLNRALEVMTDNPKKFVFLFIKYEYDNLGHLNKYKNNELEFFNLVKLAINYENERMYDSIFAIKSAFRKIV